MLAQPPLKRRIRGERGRVALAEELDGLVGRWERRRREWFAAQPVRQREPRVADAMRGDRHARTCLEVIIVLAVGELPQDRADSFVAVFEVIVGQMRV
jgi:hypothetical protein